MEMLSVPGNKWDDIPKKKEHELEKDDASTQAKIVYYILLFIFFLLVLIGVFNLILVIKIKKLSKQVATFYFVSLTIVLL